MISSLLVANRGEIARRIIRTARRLGIRAIAVYSEADAGLPHVTEADEAVLIGPANPAQSYRNVEAILAAAKSTGAEAIHPGYGFLSENAEFARTVAEHGLIWV
jgi:acetyl-CoA carboxylase biotin carboxylase subunit